MQTTWSQDIFSKGELSPLMYSRVTVSAYYNGLKKAKNAITYPQGATGKRFGTIYLAEIPTVTNYLQMFFESFQYLNECTYVLVFIPDNILIYLEGILVFTVTSTGIVASVIQLIDSTVLSSRFRVTTGLTIPHDLIRKPNSANVITTVNTGSNTISVTTPMVAGLVLPAQFTTSGSFPSTTPVLRAGKTYFIKTVTTTTFKIYSTAENAVADEGAFTVANAGTPTSNLVTLNAWTFPAIIIQNYPVYDFSPEDGLNYTTSTYTMAAVTGFNIQVTATVGTPFLAAMVGGMFAGNGGSSRIKTVDSSTVIHVDIVQDFAASSTTGIPGTLVILAEPAWSDARSWPQKCSSFQNRAVFGGTDLLPNGLWLSVTNSYNDFYDLEADDDFAISYFPSSDNVNVIKFIVPYRSLTIHTNTGIYSTPLSNEQAVTPSNFSMALQDSTPATSIQPRAIDNQIIILSGNDVHSMLWDGFNSSYTSTIASIANEHLIRSPHDEAAYVDLNKAGSRYMFIINDDGTMVIFQTLISENVQGFTPATLEQSYGNAYFRWATSSSDGKAWFITEREIASAVSAVPLQYSNEAVITATGSNFPLTGFEACLFTTTAQLPLSTPQLELNTYYWGVGINVNQFSVYLTQAEALTQENPVIINTWRGAAFVQRWPLVSKFYLEQLSFEVFVDCAGLYDGTATNSIPGQPRFNAQDIKINGDGFGFDDTVVDGTVTIEAHGALTDVSVANYGFPINWEIQPLQVSPIGPGGPKASQIAFPQHIRYASFMFTDTIGGYINGTPIQLQSLEQIVPGEPPLPLSGVYEQGFMLGWNDVNKYPITITHSEPFDIKLIGIFYQIES